MVRRASATQFQEGGTPLRRGRMRNNNWLLVPIVAAAANVGACGGGNDGEGTSPENAVTASAPGAVSAAPLRQQLHGHVTSEIRSARVTRHVPPSTVLNVGIGVPPRDAAALAALKRAVSDPESPQYRRYIGADEFSQTFGASDEDYETIVAWAESKGLVVDRAHPNHLYISLSGTSDLVEHAFNVTMNFHERGDGTEFYALDREPTIDLAVPVQHVSGLENRLRPRAGIVNGSAANGEYIGSDFRTAYLGSTLCSSLTGSNQTVGLAELDGYSSQDLTAYIANAKATTYPPVTNDVLPGASATPMDLGYPATGPLAPIYDLQASEVAMDIELVMSMAPGLANVEVFIGTSGDQILAAMATMPSILQLSSSWFVPIDANAQMLMDELVVQGQSFFEASGDSGGYVTDTEDWRSLDGVTVVGGTSLNTGPGATYQSENPTVYGGGFLGLDASFGNFVPIPYYQQGIATNGASTTYRNVPDVSMVSYAIDVYATLPPYGQWGTAPASPGTLLPYAGGTSAAAPLWAAFMALANQQSASAGLGPVGFANPALYTVARNSTAYGTSFNDVLNDGQSNSQENGPGFFAGPGYDLVTGWGSPQCGLISQLASGGIEHQATVLSDMGFRTFGGNSQNLCLGHPDVAVGAGLFSETCTDSPDVLQLQSQRGSDQGWVLGSNGTISPATNTGLCLEEVDINGFSGFALATLQLCSGVVAGSQTWSVGNNIVAFSGKCLWVAEDIPESGVPVYLASCQASEGQDFWPWNLPLAIGRDVGALALNNSSNGSILDETSSTRTSLGFPLNSQTFMLTYDHQIIDTDPSSSTTGYCLNEGGFFEQLAQLSMQPCTGGAQQSWYFTQAGFYSGISSWANIRSLVVSNGLPECVDVQGDNSTPGTTVDVYACNGTLAQVWSIAPLMTDEVGSGGY
jgi:hypothetical protein